VDKERERGVGPERIARERERDSKKKEERKREKTTTTRMTTTTTERFVIAHGRCLGVVGGCNELYDVLFVDLFYQQQRRYSCYGGGTGEADGLPSHGW